MTEYILNPRRTPRIPVHCTIRLGLRSGGFVYSRTADVGPKGCGGEAAFRAPVGERAFVEIKDPLLGGAHLLSGHVAWSSSAAPWRWGIAFDPGSRHAAAALYEALATAYPDAVAKAEPVEKIPANALLTPVPGALTTALPAEAEVLRAVRGGVEANALRAELGERWDRCINPLFALVERGALEVQER